MTNGKVSTMTRQKVGTLLVVAVLIVSVLAIGFGCTRTKGPDAPDKDAPVIEPPKIVSVYEYPKPDYPKVLVDGTYAIPEGMRYMDGESTIVPAIQDFTLRTTPEFIADGDQVNTCYSPASLFYSLSMAAHGAGTETRDQLFNVIGMPDDYTLLNEYKDLFLNLYINSDADTKITNSLWLRLSEDSYMQNYRESMKAYFYAELFEAQFGTEDADAAMMQWAKDNTGGNVTPEITSAEDWQIALMSSLHFKAAWATPFDESASFQAEFHAESGDVTADYMQLDTSNIPSDYRQTKDYTAVDIPFVDGTSMKVILPSQKSSVNALMSNPELLADALYGEANATAGITYTLPKFSFSDSYALAEDIEAMGAPLAFHQGADFSTMLEGQGYISSLDQDTHVMINEQGAEGGAFTQMTAVTTSLTPDTEDKLKTLNFTASRPFIYAINSPEGVTLFVGTVGDPTVGDAGYEILQEESSLDDEETSEDGKPAESAIDHPARSINSL